VIYIDETTVPGLWLVCFISYVIYCGNYGIDLFGERAFLSTSQSEYDTKRSFNFRNGLSNAK
jgi:hypothetical protein